MNTPHGDDRFAPPQAHVADVMLPPEGNLLATRKRRLAAGLIDMVIALGLLWVVSRITPWNPFDMKDYNPWGLKWANAAAGFVLFIAVHGYLLANRGQTIGKALLQMRIVRPDGSRASVQRLIGLRYGVGSIFAIVPVAAQIYGLLDAVLIFGARRRCLHDRIADTVVIKI
jgi:uncharacterized RDD family membrane protein YckC